MRVLVRPRSSESAELDGLDGLDGLYAVPRRPWLRVNMVTSLDGAATGESGRSGSINNAVDQRVFAALRGMADVIVVGAGTARAEGYRPTDRPIVVVSRRGAVPETLRGAAPGSVLVEAAPDPVAFKQSLVDRGWTSILCEGGPSLLRDLLAAGVVDELCTTIVPRLVAGEHPRILTGPPVDVPLRLESLLESDGTLLARWLI